MAANGFIELLRLSKRGNKNYASVQNEAQESNLPRIFANPFTQLWVFGTGVYFGG
jgi:hypothetical protein